MRISDWSSDVCSSDLHLEHSLNLRRLERRFRTMTAAAARMDRWCEFRPLAKFSKRQRSVMGIVIFPHGDDFRSEEHTSELQSLMRISYAVFCLKKKTKSRTTYTKNLNLIHRQ